MPYINVKTKFAKEPLELRYIELIEKTLEEISKTPLHCVITLGTEKEIPKVNKETKKEEDQTKDFISNIDKKYTFENFVVGPSNQ